MKRITGVRWGANRDLLLRYYHVTIYSELSYSCSISGSAAPTLSKLEVIQNAAFRITMGAMRSSPITVLQAKSGVLPLYHRRREILFHHYQRSKFLTPSHPLIIFHANSGVDPYDPVWLPRAR